LQQISSQLYLIPYNYYNITKLNETSERNSLLGHRNEQ
jgi:hypothetical protein